jgi:hypothetical protein
VKRLLLLLAVAAVAAVFVRDTVRALDWETA